MFNGMVFVHPRFRDVAWAVKQVRHRKKGYVDVLFMWIHPETEHRQKAISIFGTLETKRIPVEKWHEFENKGAISI